MPRNAHSALGHFKYAGTKANSYAICTEFLHKHSLKASADISFAEYNARACPVNEFKTFVVMIDLQKMNWGENRANVFRGQGQVHFNKMTAMVA